MQVEPESMRVAYGTTLAELGANHKDIVVLDADLSCSTQTQRFGDKFPNRFFNVGIAEQNMADVSAGLSIAGKIVFMSSFAVFLSRAYEQIRNAIAIQNLNVKIVATHGGISVGPDGGSHQMLEDFNLMRGLPNMKVFVPADARETAALTKALVNINGPCYMRVSRMSVLPIYSKKFKFDPFKADVLKRGKDVSLFASGLMVKEAMEAADMLKKEGINAEVINVHCLKPIDSKTLLNSARKTGAVVTSEEHSIYGGLGSATAEILAEHYPVPMIRIGVKDKFGQSGKPEELFKFYGLTAKDIYKAAKKVLKRKEGKK